MIEVRLFATFREGREKISYVEPEKAKMERIYADYIRSPVRKWRSSLLTAGIRTFRNQ